MKKQLQHCFASLIFLCCSNALATDALDEGMCVGFVSMFNQRGISLQALSDVAFQQAKSIFKKYENVEQKYSPTVRGCFIEGAPIRATIDCFEKKIPDKNAALFLKGYYLARNGFPSSNLAAEEKTNTVCGATRN